MKKLIIILSISLTSSVLFSQSYWNLTYDMSIPLGDTKELANQVSFRGFGIDGRGFVNDNVTIGGSWSWNVFYERRNNQYYYSGSKTIYGNQFRTSNAMPFMLTSHYYFGEDGGLRTYIGSGAGTIWKEDRLQGGTLSTTSTGWQFGLTPEVGVFIPVGTTAFIFLNAKYTHGFMTGKVNNTSYLNFGIGLGWENF